MNIEENIKPLKILMSKYKQIDEMNNFDHELALVIDYTELSAIETLLTAYEKEKEKNKELSNSYDKLAKECNEENRRCMLLAVENQDLKEKNKKAIDFINERKKTVNKDMAEGTRLQVGTFMWQVDELLEILKEE